MGTITWMDVNTHNVAFVVEFDDSDVSSELSELIYGLIENANGDAHRQNDSIKSQRECIAHLRQENLTLSLELNTLKENEIETLDLDNEFNDIGNGVYAKANV